MVEFEKMNGDVDRTEQDSLITAEQQFRELCLMIAAKNENAAPRKKLFSITSLKKQKLRQSIIDRACLRTKVISSTPMISSRKKSFTPNHSCSVSVIEEISRLKEVPADTPPLQDEELPGDNNYLVTISSLEARGSLSGKSRPTSPQSVCSKKSRIESIASRLNNVANRSIQTSFKAASSVKKIARAPSKYVAKEMETQTGESLETRNPLILNDGSDLFDDMPDLTEEDELIWNWEENKYLTQNIFFEMELKTGTESESGSDRDVALPWRAASNLDSHVVQTPENAIRLDDWAEREESLDETFRPKPPKSKKVFINKKSIKNNRRSNARNKSIKRVDEEDTGTNVFLRESCKLKENTQKNSVVSPKVIITPINVNDISKLAKAVVASKSKTKLSLKQLPENDVPDEKRKSENRNRKENNLKKNRKNSTVNQAEVVEEELNHSEKEKSCRYTKINDKSSSRKNHKKTTMKGDDSKNGNICDDLITEAEMDHYSSPLRNEPSGVKSLRNLDLETKTNENNSRHQRSPNKERISRNVSNTSPMRTRRRSRHQNTVLEDRDDDNIQDVSFDINRNRNSEILDSSAMQMNRRNCLGIPKDLLEEFQELATDFRNVNSKENDSNIQQQSKENDVKDTKTNSKKKPMKTATADNIVIRRSVRISATNPQEGTSQSPTRTVPATKGKSKSDVLQRIEDTTEERNGRPVRKRQPPASRAAGYFVISSRPKNSSKFLIVESSENLIQSIRGNRARSRGSTQTKKSRKLTTSSFPSRAPSLSPIKEAKNDMVDNIIQNSSFEAPEIAASHVDEEPSTSGQTGRGKKTKKSSIISGGVRKPKLIRNTSIRKSVSNTLENNDLEEINDILNVWDGDSLKSIQWAFKEPRFESVKGMAGVSCMTSSVGAIGILKLEPGKSKPKQTAVSYSIHFGIMDGHAHVEIQDKKAEFKKHEMFIVPKGGEYSIKNLSANKPLFLFFTRSCQT